jgi:hypothetical protein
VTELRFGQFLTRCFGLFRFTSDRLRGDLPFSRLLRGDAGEGDGSREEPRRLERRRDLSLDEDVNIPILAGTTVLVTARTDGCFPKLFTL